MLGIGMFCQAYSTAAVVEAAVIPALSSPANMAAEPAKVTNLVWRVRVFADRDRAGFMTP